MILEVNEGFIWKIIFIELLYLYMVDIICIYYIELLSTYVYIYIYGGYYIFDNNVIWPIISGFSR